ncbi:RNA-directed DNA polymerase from mobile element jockey-like [Brachionus plicatilis]|uniref:RNA-directed DNA polymerase from mobile element jockey-like n=1 Tax=Brachionus plicatilis TaxID=10195 RepID=A0A3M7R7V8_BRAPC|nr:RNA-directed DNA polymerase from mobile element jockey-like [Brachionus plicatilis]
MNGCTRSMIQSYIDEYVWRFNNSCTTDSNQAYEQIHKEIAKNHKPGNFVDITKHSNIIDEELFEIDSQTSSDNGSESDLADLIVENLSEEDLKIEVHELPKSQIESDDETTANEKSTTHSNTVKFNNGFNEVSWVNPLVQCSSLTQTGPARGIRGHKRRLSGQPSTKCMQRSNFFTNRVDNHWNALPAEVTDSQSINQFKNNYEVFKSSI